MGRAGPALRVDGVPVLIGTIAQIVEQLSDARERWGITRWVVRLDALEVAEQVIAVRS